MATALRCTGRASQSQACVPPDGGATSETIYRRHVVHAYARLASRAAARRTAPGNGMRALRAICLISRNRCSGRDELKHFRLTPPGINREAVKPVAKAV